MRGNEPAPSPRYDRVVLHQRQFDRQREVRRARFSDYRMLPIPVEQVESVYNNKVSVDVNIPFKISCFKHHAFEEILLGETALSAYHTSEGIEKQKGLEVSGSESRWAMKESTLSRLEAGVISSSFDTKVDHGNISQGGKKSE